MGSIRESAPRLGAGSISAPTPKASAISAHASSSKVVVIARQGQAHRSQRGFPIGRKKYEHRHNL